MQTFHADLAVIGAGGAGLRAAIAAAQANPNAKIALISKVYPMRSHTVAAEGGSAAVAQDHDSFEYHFHDTVAGGDWLCEQDVVDYFVHHCPTEMTQLEQWGCPWSRRPDGSVNVRRFGGMKIERTWFAADKTGFHMLHTLFQTSLQFPQIQRFDEHFVLDLLVDDGQARGLQGPGCPARRDQRGAERTELAGEGNQVRFVRDADQNTFERNQIAHGRDRLTGLKAHWMGASF